MTLRFDQSRCAATDAAAVLQTMSLPAQAEEDAEPRRGLVRAARKLITRAHQDANIAASRDARLCGAWQAKDSDRGYGSTEGDGAMAQHQSVRETFSQLYWASRKAERSSPLQSADQHVPTS